MAKIPSVEWRYITGYAYDYRIGDMGNVQRRLSNGTWKELSPYKNKQNGLLYVGLVKEVGKKVNVAVIKLMDEYFFGNYAKKHGLCRTHKNGMTTDCSKYNIIFVTPTELNMGNLNRHKRVVKMDLDGNVVARYASGKEAARANFMSPTAIYNRVNHRLKNPTTLDGYIYRFEVEIDE